MKTKIPEMPAHWEACNRAELEYLAATGSYGQRLIARRYLILLAQNVPADEADSIRASLKRIGPN